MEYEESLKNDYRYIFDDIFERQVPEENSNREIYRFTNFSKKRIISVIENEYVEHVFTCLVLDHESSLLKQYFVTVNDYDVNEALDGDYISGRFIFFSDGNVENTNKLVLYALAEEYANSPRNATYIQIEDRYIAKRNLYSPGMSDL